MRSLQILLTISALLVLNLIQAQQPYRNVYFGNREYGDSFLEQREVKIPRVPSMRQVKTILFHGNGTARITRVELYDVWNNNDSAEPKLVSGGPGFTFAGIQFESKSGHGIHFLVKVYGKNDCNYS